MYSNTTIKSEDIERYKDTSIIIEPTIKMDECDFKSFKKKKERMIINAPDEKYSEIVDKKISACRLLLNAPNLIGFRNRHYKFINKSYSLLNYLIIEYKIIDNVPTPTKTNNREFFKIITNLSNRLGPKFDKSNIKFSGSIHIYDDLSDLTINIESARFNISRKKLSSLLNFSSIKDLDTKELCNLEDSISTSRGLKRYNTFLKSAMALNKTRSSILASCIHDKRITPTISRKNLVIKSLTR